MKWMYIYMYIYIYIDIKKNIRVNGWEMVGNKLGYPTYVLQAVAFLAGALFCLHVPSTNDFVCSFVYKMALLQRTNITNI